MEAARKLKDLKHFVYASSSSVYGANTKLPFSVDDPVEHPVSLYAATKRSMELMSESYARMYGLPLTGLRFFTVYGPWGRPDMAAYIFTKKIMAGEPIPVFNNGEMRRDFTFIDDIVSGILGVLATTPKSPDGTPHRVYNLGNNRSEQLMRFVQVLEEALQRKAEIDFQPLQPGEAQRQLIATLGARQGVRFVDHHGLEAREDLRGLRIAHQERQALGRGQQDVGWAFLLALTAVLRRVAGARLDGDVEAHFGDRHFEVALHVDGERLQGRDVERVERALFRRGAGSEIEEAREEAGERLAGACRRDQERGFALRRECRERKLMRAGMPTPGGEPAGEERGECIVMRFCGKGGRFVHRGSVEPTLPLWEGRKIERSENFSGRGERPHESAHS
jgi:dTDP-4-dehydrorhamnose reductase